MGWLGQPDKPEEPQKLPPPSQKKWWKSFNLLTKWRNIMNDENAIAGVDVSMLVDLDEGAAQMAVAPNSVSNQNILNSQAAPKKKGPKPGYLQEKIAAAAAALAAQNNPVAAGGSTLYFVEGMVQAITDNGTSKQHAQQSRIVWANNAQDAMQKYTNYFASLNNPTTFYSVINMACSEAIA